MYASWKSEIALGVGSLEDTAPQNPLLECTADISSHLKRCHLSKEKIHEFELILF